MVEFSQCAWCNDFIEQGTIKDEGICQSCIEELGKVPNLEVENISRNFVDNLPFGNIVLDKANRVIRYNATEAKYTGYDASRIEGKNFFEDVAPCTRVDLFQGKLEEFRNTVPAENQQYLFKFFFDHPRFKGMVSILMTYYKNGYAILSIRQLKESKRD